METIRESLRHLLLHDDHMSRVPLTVEAVAALSPDDASLKAARGLVSPAKWPTLGASDVAVWGECQGSGSKPYQTQADVSGSGPTFRCSCPSRKFPCKHGLALLLLQAQQAANFTAPEPNWVTEWLASRQQRAEKKEAKAAAAPAVADPAAIAKREAQRMQRMAAGAQELARWLDDTSRKGLAALSDSDAAAWRTMAARMVDAQAPGLGQRLNQAWAVIGQGADWPARLLPRLGNLQLLVDAVCQPEPLTPALQADMRQALGWSLERDDVLAHGERVSDVWVVLAQVLQEREPRLTERRVWLRGCNSQRLAVLIDHSYAGAAFDHGWTHDVSQSCTLAFYPGADPLRALLAESVPAAASEAALARRPPAAAVDHDAWGALAQRMAANPWAQSWPLHLDGVQLQYSMDAQPQWWLHTEAQRAIPLAMTDADGWQLMALGAGTPMAVFGEWTGEHLRPLSAWPADGLWASSPLSGDAA